MVPVCKLYLRRHEEVVIVNPGTYIVNIHSFSLGWYAFAFYWHFWKKGVPSFTH